jgi:hypothetical protein
MKAIPFLFIATLPLLTGCESFLQETESQNTLSSAPSSGYYSDVPQKIDFQITAVTNLFNTFPWDSLKKSEFESQAEFTSRIKSIPLDTNSVFIEVDFDQAKHIYDAEKKRLYLGISRDNYPVFQQPTSDCRFTIALSIKAATHDVEQNAYGAKVDTTFIDGKKLQIECVNLFQIPNQVRPVVNDNETIGFLIPMDGKDAENKLNSKSLCLVLKVQPTKPEWAGKFFEGNNPTFDDPTGFYNDVYDLPVHLSAIKLIDKSSDMVLASWDESIASSIPK